MGWSTCCHRCQSKSLACRTTDLPSKLQVGILKRKKLKSEQKAIHLRHSQEGFKVSNPGVFQNS